MKSLLMAGVLGLAAAVPNYGQTYVTVADSELKEDDTEPMKFIATWFTEGWGAGTTWESAAGVSPGSKLELQASYEPQFDVYEVGKAKSIDLNTLNPVQVSFYAEKSVPNPTATLEVFVVDDEVSEVAVEVFNMKLTPVTHGVVCLHANSNCIAQGTIKEVDEVVELTIADAEVTEGSGLPLRFKVELSHKIEGSDVVVNWQTSTPSEAHTATAGEDYTQASGSLTFVDSVDVEHYIEIAQINDDIQENLETMNVVVTFPAVSNSLSAGTVSAVGKFTEEDEGAFVSVKDIVQEEGDNGGTFDFQISLSHKVDKDVMVKVNVTDVAGDLSAKQCSSTEFDDSTACNFMPESLDGSEFTIGQLSTSTTYRVKIKNDDIQSTHTRKLGNDATWGPLKFSLKATIDEMSSANNQGKSMWNVHLYQDDDDVQAVEVDHITFDGFIYDRENGIISITNTEVTATEGDDFTVSINFSKEATARVPVAFGVLQGTATPCSVASLAGSSTGCDVAYLDRAISGGGPGDQDIDVGFVFSPLTFDLDDDVAEPTEKFEFKISPAVETGADFWEYSISQSKNLASITIVDNDILSITGFASPTTKVDEGDSYSFSVGLSFPTSVDYKMYYSTEANTAGSEDFVEISATELNFAASNSAAQTENFDVFTTEDDIAERNERFFVSVETSPETTALFGQKLSKKVTLEIGDDDEVGIVWAAVDEKLFRDEGSLQFTYKATLSHAISEDLEFKWSTNQIVADSVYCVDPSGASQLKLTGVACTGVELSASAATPNADFVPRTSETFIFDSLQTAPFHVLTLSTVYDSIQEHPIAELEYFDVVLEPLLAAQEVFRAGETTFKVYISDDEEFEVEVGDAVGTENAVEFTIKLSHQVDADLNLAWEVTNTGGTAGAADFLGNAFPTGTATISKLTTSTVVTVDTLDDDVHEETETFTFKFTQAAVTAVEEYGGIILRQAATGRIEDSSASTIGFKLANQEGSEGQSISVAVKLSHQQSYGGNPVDVVVDIEALTGEGSAFPADYSFASQTVTILSTALEESFNLDLTADQLFEAEETVVFLVSNPRSSNGSPLRATLDTNRTTVTIKDIDQIDLEWVQDTKTSTNGEGGTLTFEIKMNKPLGALNNLGANDTSQDVTLSYVVSQAPADTSYAAATLGTSCAIGVDGAFVDQTFTSEPFSRSELSASSTATIKVVLCDDDIQEGSGKKGVQVSLVNNPFQIGGSTSIDLNGRFTGASLGAAVGTFGDVEGAKVFAEFVSASLPSASLPGYLVFQVSATHQTSADVPFTYRVVGAQTQGAVVCDDSTSLDTNCDFEKNEGNFLIPASRTSSNYPIVVNVTLRSRDSETNSQSPLRFVNIEFTSTNGGGFTQYPQGSDETRCSGICDLGQLVDSRQNELTLALESSGSQEDSITRIVSVTLKEDIASSLPEIPDGTVRGTLTTESGSALEGEDFTAFARNFEFPAREGAAKSNTKIQFSIIVINDNVLEPEEEFYVKLSNLRVGQDTSFFDNDVIKVMPAGGNITLTIAQSVEADVELFITPTIVQTETDFVFTASLSNPSAIELAFDCVLLQDSGASAVASTLGLDASDDNFADTADFPSGMLGCVVDGIFVNSLVFKAGQQSVDVTILVNEDTTQEYDEYFAVKLSQPAAGPNPSAGYPAGAIKIGPAGDIYALGNIKNDDVAVLKVSSAEALEGDSLNFVVALSHAVDQDVTVEFSVSELLSTSIVGEVKAPSYLRADKDVDMTGTTAGSTGLTVTWLKNTLPADKQVTISTVADTILEPTEYIRLKANKVRVGTTDFSSSYLTLWTEDNADDTDLDTTRRFYLDQSAKEGVYGKILDQTGSVMSWSTWVQPSEGPNTKTLVAKLSLSSVPSSELSFDVDASGYEDNLHFPADTDDYSVSTKRVRFTKSSYEDVAVSISIKNDDTQEYDESFRLNLTPTDETKFSAFATLTMPGAAQGVVTITDNEEATVEFYGDGYSVLEGNDVKVDMRLTHFVDYGIEVKYELPLVGADTAMKDEDFIGTFADAKRTFLFSAGKKEPQMTLSVETVDDFIAERDETFTIKATSAGITAPVPPGQSGVDKYTKVQTNTKVEPGGFQVVTILDNENAYLWVGGTDDKAQAEGAEGEAIQFQAKLSHKISENLEFRWSTTDGTAIKDSKVLVFTTDQLVKDFFVATKNDDIQNTFPRNSKQFTLTIDQVQTAKQDAPKDNLGFRVATGARLDGENKPLTNPTFNNVVNAKVDDDEEATLKVSSAKAKETENLVFTVTLSHQFDVPVEFDVETKPATATPGGCDEGTTNCIHDYFSKAWKGIKLVTTSAADSRVSEPLTVNLIDDIVSEQDEVFNVVVDWDSVNVRGQMNINLSELVGVGTIEANTEDGSKVSVMGATAESEEEGLEFALELTHPYGYDLTINLDFTQPAIRALSEDDFENPLPSVFIIPAGDTSSTIAIAVKADAISEADESLMLSIQCADCNTTKVTGVVKGAEGVPDCKFFYEAGKDYTVEDTALTFQCVLATEGQDVQVDWVVLAAVGKDTVTGEDFYGGSLPSGSFTLNKAINYDHKFDILVAQDTIAEPTEYFNVEFTFVGLGETSLVEGTIVSDDPVNIAVTLQDPANFQDPRAVAAEGEVLVFLLDRSGSSLSAPVDVEFTVGAATGNPPAPDGALAASFVGARKISLAETFEAGDGLELTVRINDDTFAELEEDFDILAFVPEEWKGSFHFTFGGNNVNSSFPVRVPQNDLATLAVVPRDALEGEELLFEFTLTNPLLFEKNINWNATNGTTSQYASPEDFEVSSGTVVFATGEQRLFVKVDTFADDLVEVDELVVFEVTTLLDGLSHPYFTNSGSFTSGSAKIKNDDIATVTFVQGTTRKRSSSNTARYTEFTAKLSKPLSEDLTLNVTTSQGTSDFAITACDFNIECNSSHIVVFKAGSTQAEPSLTNLNSKDTDFDGAFEVKLLEDKEGTPTSSLSQFDINFDVLQLATLTGSIRQAAVPAGVGWIAGGTGTKSLSVSITQANTCYEENGSCGFQLQFNQSNPNVETRLDRHIYFEYRVDLTKKSGYAAKEDFKFSKTSTITGRSYLKPGQNTLHVDIVNDDLAEGVERFSVTITKVCVVGSNNRGEETCDSGLTINRRKNSFEGAILDDDIVELLSANDKGYQNGLRVSDVANMNATTDTAARDVEVEWSRELGAPVQFRRFTVAGNEANRDTKEGVNFFGFNELGALPEGMDTDLLITVVARTDTVDLTRVEGSDFFLKLSVVMTSDAYSLSSLIACQLNNPGQYYSCCNPTVTLTCQNEEAEAEWGESKITIVAPVVEQEETDAEETGRLVKDSQKYAHWQGKRFFSVPGAAETYLLRLPLSLENTGAEKCTAANSDIVESISCDAKFLSFDDTGESEYVYKLDLKANQKGTSEICIVFSALSSHCFSLLVESIPDAQAIEPVVLIYDNQVSSCRQEITFSTVNQIEPVFTFHEGDYELKAPTRSAGSTQGVVEWVYEFTSTAAGFNKGDFEVEFCRKRPGAVVRCSEKVTKSVMSFGCTP